jgi:hypothetical protein
MNQIHLAARLAQGLLAVTIVFAIGLVIQRSTEVDVFADPLPARVRPLADAGDAGAGSLRQGPQARIGTGG